MSNNKYKVLLELILNLLDFFEKGDTEFYIKLANDLEAVQDTGQELRDYIFDFMQLYRHKNFLHLPLKEYLYLTDVDLILGNLRKFVSDISYFVIAANNKELIYNYKAIQSQIPNIKLMLNRMRE